MRIPSVITAGDSATWIDLAFADAVGASVDAGSYALTYSLRGPVANAALDLASVPQGPNWSFALTSAQTAALNAGAASARWYWTAFASKTGVRLTAGSGTLTVAPNLAGLTNTVYDGRSAAEKALAAIEAEISARLNGGATVEYTIGSRSLKKEPLAALMTLRSQYRLIVSRERRSQQLANGLGNPQRLGVRFR